MILYIAQIYSLKKMFNLFGVEQIEYEQNVFKHTPDDLTEIIQNFDELYEYYRGSRYERYLIPS